MHKRKYGWKFISMVNIHIVNYIYIFYYMILYQRSNKYKNNWLILKEIFYNIIEFCVYKKIGNNEIH